MKKEMIIAILVSLIVTVIMNLAVNLTGNAVSTSSGTNYFSVRNDNGYLNLGPGSEYYAHFYTDRPSYYFNKGAFFDGDLSPYNVSGQDLGSPSKKWDNLYVKEVNADKINGIGKTLMGAYKGDKSDIVSVAVPKWASPNTTDHPLVYNLTLNLKQGDIVYLDTQAEVTSDNGARWIMSVVYITADNGLYEQDVSPRYVQNVDQSIHHLTMKTNGVYTIPQDGVYTFRTRAYFATGTGTGYKMTIEPAQNSGQLLAMVFR